MINGMITEINAFSRGKANALTMLVIISSRFVMGLFKHLRTMITVKKIAQKNPSEKSEDQCMTFYLQRLDSLINIHSRGVRQRQVYFIGTTPFARTPP
jgi:hypothetical protein